MKLLCGLVCIATVAFVASCISLPDVYLIDRHTVMEAEASGEWPQLEQRFSEQTQGEGPVNLAKEPSQARSERVFRVLNSEFADPASTQQP